MSVLRVRPGLKSAERRIHLDEQRRVRAQVVVIDEVVRDRDARLEVAHLVRRAKLS